MLDVEKATEKFFLEEFKNYESNDSYLGVKMPRNNFWLAKNSFQILNLWEVLPWVLSFKIKYPTIFSTLGGAGFRI